MMYLDYVNNYYFRLNVFLEKYKKTNEIKFIASEKRRISRLIESTMVQKVTSRDDQQNIQKSEIDNFEKNKNFLGIRKQIIKEYTYDKDSVDKNMKINISEYSNEFTYPSEYDIDIVNIYHKIDDAWKEQEHNLKIKSATKEKFKEDIIDFIIEYCRYKKIDFLVHFYEIRHLIISPIIVNDYELSCYKYALAITLLFYDKYKIKKLLDYQKGKSSWPKFIEDIESHVYNKIKNSTPFKNTIALKKIMEWVRESQQEIINRSDNIPQNGTSENHTDKVIKNEDHINYKNDITKDKFDNFIKTVLYENDINNEIYLKFTNLIHTGFIEKYKDKIRWTNYQYLLVYIIDNLKKHEFILMEPDKFIMDNFSFKGKKNINKSYIMVVREKYTVRSSKVQTDIDNKFNLFCKIK
jgi:hypothetical protein